MVSKMCIKAGKKQSNPRKNFATGGVLGEGSITLKRAWESTQAFQDVRGKHLESAKASGGET